jgi:hypothetical protein
MNNSTAIRSEKLLRFFQRNSGYAIKAAMALCLSSMLVVACGGGSKGTPTGTGGRTGGGTGGAGPTDCGGPGQLCCTGNICNSGGCCIPMASDAGGGNDRICVSAGQTCTGMNISGTCTAGSCTDTAGTACGSLNQVCCGIAPVTDAGGGGGGGFCTASGSRCTM